MRIQLLVVMLDVLVADFVRFLDVLVEFVGGFGLETRVEGEVES